MVLFYTNSHFQYISVPFERISLINFFSLVLPRGGALEHVNFCPGGRGFAAFFAQGGISPPQKNSPGIGPGDVTAGIDWYINYEIWCGLRP